MQGSSKIAVGVRVRKIRASWWIDIHREQLRARHNLRVLTREEAEREGRLLVAQLEAGELTVESIRFTLEKAILKYLKSDAQIDDRTRENRETILGRFQDFVEARGITLLERVKKVHIAEFRDASLKRKVTEKKTISPVTVRNWLEKISSFFKWAVEDSLVRRNPTLGVKVKVPPARAKAILTPDEIKKLMAACSPPLRDLVLVLVNTGLRIGEAVDLKAGDLNSKRGTLELLNSKAKRYETVQLNEVALRVLRAKKLAAKGGALFRSATGSPMDRRNVRRDLIEAGVQARLKVSGPHMLRRSFCSALAPLVSAAVLKEAARHKDLRTTMNYYVNLPTTAPPIVAS